MDGGHNNAGLHFLGLGMSYWSEGTSLGEWPPPGCGQVECPLVIYSLDVDGAWILSA